MDDLISRQALYEKTAEWEAQAFHMVEVTMNDEDKTEWRKWSVVLKERSAFKFDVADAPSVEPVIIKCIDCKWYDMAKNEANGFCREHGCTFFPWDFCSWAEMENSDESN